MTVLKYTNDELKNAKKAGFRRKKPKLYSSGSYAKITNSVERYNDWIRELKAKAKEGKKLEALKKSVKAAKR